LLKHKTFGSSLLIAGTCIGAGMLALPIATAQAGFFLSIGLLLVCWGTMWLTGLYVLEANLGLPDNANFISMARHTLGRGGEVVAWITYLLLLYSLMAAYLTAGGDIFYSAVKEQFVHLPSWVGPIPWVTVVASIVYFGVRTVDGLNRLLMLGLVLAYILLVASTTAHIHPDHFKMGEVGHLFLALPVLMAAFGYHVIVPSLRHYLQGHVPRLAFAIFLGCLLSLIVYFLWELVIFGTLPMGGQDGLMAIAKSGHPATKLTSALANLTKSPWLVTVVEFFIFFAIASSFVGISVSLFDFLSDGLGITKSRVGRLGLAFLTFLPPLFYAWFFPRGFVLAISYAGVFVAILHGILPASMVWVGRKRGFSGRYRAPGGVAGLIGILLFSVVVIVAELIETLL